MAKYSIDTINEELKEYGWKCISETYKNLNEPLVFVCEEGHRVYSTWGKIRTRRECPVCASNQYKDINTKIRKKKSGAKRILALDQSTKITGYSVFDNDELITYGTFETQLADDVARDHEVKVWLISMLDAWKPDYIGIEGIQYQQSFGVTTFEKLARLQGILLELCYDLGYKYSICPTNTWRHHCGVKGRSITNSTKIPTINGWKTVGEITTNDILFDALGKPTKVLAVYPQGKLDVVKITFKDGRFIYCSKDHLWSFNTLRQRELAKKNRQFKTKTCEEIINIGIKSSRKEYKILVPYCYPVEYTKKELPILPYILGCMLGDGSFRLGKDKNRVLQFSSKNDFLPKKIASIMNWDIKKSGNLNYTYYFSYKDKKIIKKYGHKNVQIKDFLSEFPELINTNSQNKFIPQMYLTSSIEDRIQILQGLIDTDGSTSGGRMRFTTISKTLAYQVQEIVFSLGLSSNIQLVQPRGFGKQISYIVSLYGNPNIKKELVTIDYKKNNLINNYKFKYNPIINIEYLNYQEEMTCFLVDNPEHLFLVGDYIVTHNTRVDKKRSTQYLIKQWYDISVNEDVADAIGIGKYMSESVLSVPEIVEWE